MATRRTFLILGGVAALAGCGGAGGRWNPLNWFRPASRAERVTEVSVTRAADDRPLVRDITALSVERRPGGAIIRATGLPPTQGWYDAALVAEESDAAGVLTYTFRARPPEAPTRVSTAQSRELVAARYLSDIDLAGVRAIRVLGAATARTARR